MMTRSDTIVAAATAPGGALSLIRVSGPQALEIVGKAFRPAGKRTLGGAKGFSIIYGDITDEGGESVDDVLVSVFRAPNSYTGDDMAEISCHGSAYIVRRIIELLVRYGARTADAGEFTTRAFLAGKIDLSQAEAVADMIASRDRAAHLLAVNQMKGGYSDALRTLRDELLRLASLLELELDFSEEDVEFADRGELAALTRRLVDRLSGLADSFSLGNAIKEGVGVAIVGSPNVGKSTLLNALLRDDRAMVSDVAGTTRDVIEESVAIDGVRFRFIDTAGIRESGDALEKMGMERTFRSLEKAAVVLYVVDINEYPGAVAIAQAISRFGLREEQKVCVVLNKCDEGSGAPPETLRPTAEPAASGRPVDECLTTDRDTGAAQSEIDCAAVADPPASGRGNAGVPQSAGRYGVADFHVSGGGGIVAPYHQTVDCDDNIVLGRQSTSRKIVAELRTAGFDALAISAKYGGNLDALTEYLSSLVDRESVLRGDTVVSNSRHYEALLNARASLEATGVGIASGLSGDLLAQDIRQALYWLGVITGEITTDEILGEIFSKFCIGK